MEPQQNNHAPKNNIEQRLKHSTQKLARVLRRCEAKKRVPRKKDISNLK